MSLINFSRKPKYSILSGEYEGLDFIGHYDLGLLTYKDKSNYPYMLGISVQGFKTDARKLPTNDARPAIDEFEDLLIGLVEKSTNCIYAGHSFWNGALEIILYVDEYKKTVEHLEQEAKNKHALTISIKVDSDPEWEQLDQLTYTI